MSYADCGSGLPVVLMHGFGNDHLLWGPQLATLPPRYHVIAPDLRGFGTAQSTDGTAVTMDQYADDVIAFLDTLRIERAVFAGISLGGYVALSIGLRHPRRVHGLVLANTRAGGDNAAQKQSRDALAAAIRQDGAQAVVDAFGDRPLRPDCPAAVKEELRAMYLRQPATGLLSSTLGMRDRPDRSDRLGEIRVPTLVITGTADVLIPPSESEPIHRAISSSHFVNLPGAGHYSNIDSAAAFNAALEPFLASFASKQP